LDLFFYLDDGVRAHAGTEGASDALVLVSYGSDAKALLVNAVGHDDDLDRAYTGAQLASFAPVFLKRDLRHLVTDTSSFLSLISPD
jgi:hypothetical protein